MRILLDECLPKKLRRYLTDHFVVTATEAGWSAYENGELASHAKGQFDVILTADKRFVQSAGASLSGIAVVILRAESNRLDSFEPLMPRVLETLKGISAGEIVVIGKAEHEA